MVRVVLSDVSHRTGVNLSQVLGPDIDVHGAADRFSIHGSQYTESNIERIRVGTLMHGENHFLILPYMDSPTSLVRQCNDFRSRVPALVQLKKGYPTKIFFEILYSHPRCTRLPARVPSRFTP